jgi:hypothetical protein
MDLKIGNDGMNYVAYKFWEVAIRSNGVFLAL